MSARAYAARIRRRLPLILVPVVAFGCGAYVLESRQDPVYEASAAVLLRPNNPDEGVQSAGGSVPALQNGDRYVTGQMAIMRSSRLAGEVAARLGMDPASLEGRARPRQEGTSDIVRLTVRDRSAEVAALLANAFVEGYVENRRLSQVAGLQRALDELEQTIADLEAQVLSQAARLTAPDLTAPERGIVEAQVAASTERFQALIERQQDLLVDISLKRGAAEIVERSVPPASSVTPRPVRAALYGVVLGGLGGLAALAIAERLDRRIATRDDLEAISTVPVLSELPKDKRSGADPSYLAVARAPESEFAEAIRHLRTGLKFATLQRASRVVVVTSAQAGEGKTLVAANLAAAYAQAGVRTLVVSGDLRLPRIETLLQVAEPGLGLVGALERVDVAPPSKQSGPMPLAIAQFVRDTGVAGLSLLPAGRQGSSPAELLESQNMGIIFDELRQGWEMVIVDTPPLLAVADGMTLSTHCDAMVLVVAAEKARIGTVERAIQLAESGPAPLIGVALNGSVGGQRYGYGYTEPAKRSLRTR